MYSFKSHTLLGSGSKNIFIRVSYAAWIRIQKRFHSSIICCMDQDPKMYSFKYRMLHGSGSKIYLFNYHTLHGSGFRNVFIQVSYTAWIRIQKHICSSIVCCMDQDPKTYSFKYRMLHGSGSKNVFL